MITEQVVIAAYTIHALFYILVGRRTISTRSEHRAVIYDILFLFNSHFILGLNVIIITVLTISAYFKISPLILIVKFLYLLGSSENASNIL